MSRLDLIKMFGNEDAKTFNKFSKAYEKGRADERANVIVEVMDFIKYECCIDDSVTKVFEFLEQLKEKK